MKTAEQQVSRFPAGSVRAAVAALGDCWRAADPEFFRLKGFADSEIVRTEEYLRAAGAKPYQRAEWREFNEKSRRGESLI